MSVFTVTKTRFLAIFPLMNCPNGHGPMTRLKKFFLCEECETRLPLPLQAPTEIPFDLSEVPFPIAYPLAHAMDPLVCPSPSDRLDNLLFATQQAIRLSCLLLLADYLACDTHCRELDGPIRGLRMPHWGEWSVLTDKLTGFWSGHFPQSKPERPSLFTWLPKAWTAFSKGSGLGESWAPSLAQLPGLQGPASSLNDALCKARNDAAHRRTTRSSHSAQADLLVLEQLLPLVSQALQVLFPPNTLQLQRRISSNPLQIVHLSGPHLDLRFDIEAIPEVWRSVFENSEVVAVAAKSNLPLPLHPLVVPLDPDTQTEVFGGNVLLDPAALLDQVAGKQVVILGVKTFRDRNDLLEPFRRAIQRKQVEFGMGREETRLWNLAEWSLETSRFTLNELRGRKYFPECYVERSGIDNVVESCLSQSGRALLLLGEAGGGKSSLLSRLVDRLTSDSNTPEIQARRRGSDGALPLQKYLASRGSRDVVIFLSGRAAFGGDAAYSGRELLCEAVMQKAGIRSGTFKDLGELVDRLGETVEHDPQAGRKVWFVFDALNEADRFTDLLAALDQFLPAVARHAWLRLVVSLRSGAYQALDRRHTLQSRTGSGVFTNQHLFSQFLDEHTKEAVPYLSIRPFTRDEGAAAYQLRLERLPDRCAKFVWDTLTPELHELLCSPLHLHLFHETYRNQDTKPENLDETALFSAYLAHLGHEMPGLKDTISAIGRFMYEERTPVLPVEVADQWIMEWRHGLASSAGQAAKLDPIEELVSASLLMRPAEEGLGMDRKLVAFQFSHQKLCEQILLLKLHRQLPLGTLPDAENMLRWAIHATGDLVQDAPFAELIGALESEAVRLVRAGVGEPIAALLELEHEDTRNRVMGAGIVALGPMWGLTESGSPHAMGVLESLKQKAFSGHTAGERFQATLEEPTKELGRTGFSRVARALNQAGLEVLRLLLAAEPNCSDLKQNLAGSLTELGDLAVSEGDSPQARSLYEESLEINRALVAAEPNRSDCRRDLSVSLNKLGNLAVSEGGSPEARSLYEESLEISRALVAAEPTRSDLRRNLSVSLNKLGDLAVSEGDSPEARSLFEESLEIRRSLVAAEPNRSDLKRSLSVSLDRLGDLAVSEGDSTQVHSLYEESLEINRALVAAEPNRSDCRRDLSVSLNKIGNLAVSEGDSAQAHSLYEESLEIDRALVAAEPTRADLKRALSVSLDRLGDLAVSEGDSAQARSLYEESLEINRALVAAEPNRSDLRRDLSVSLGSLGDLAVSEGDSAQAHSLYEESLEIRRALVAAESTRSDLRRDLSFSLDSLGDLVVSEGDSAQARLLYEGSLEIRRTLVAAEPTRSDLRRDLSVSLDRLGDLAVSEGDSAQARLLYEESLEIDRALVAAEPTRSDLRRDLSVALGSLGNLAVSEGDSAQAHSLYEESLEIRRALVAAEPTRSDLRRDLSFLLDSLGNLAVSEGDSAQARLLYEDSLEIDRALVAAEPTRCDLRRNLWVSLDSLGDLAVSEGDSAQARALFLESLQITHALLAAKPNSSVLKRDLDSTLSKLKDLA
jgi:tetratricopeptide (TPR) repeat protein